jgi:DNA-binding IclR family transcriptional regulator
LERCLKSIALKALTKNTITSKTALRKDIEIGKRRGWFLNCEESQDAVTTLSSPFTWNGSAYIITIAGPTSRIEPRLERMAKLLIDTCRQLEMRLEVA